MVAKPVVEVEGDGLVVDVLVEVQEVCFDDELCLAEAGFIADADGGGEGLVVALEVCLACVDAVGGECVFVEGVQVEVDGGDADGSAALFALDDLAGE